jgi:predicted transcriptional regulator
MKRTTIFIDAALERDVQALARRRGQPAASVVREAIASYVTAAKRSADAPLRFVGAGRSGRRGGAARHEGLLWRSLEPHVDTPPRRRARSKRR